MGSDDITTIATIDMIQSLIYTIRGTKVILDKDLAKLYQVEVKRLNEAVKRNINRFPADFIFQLTKEEWENLKSQFATSSWGGTRKLPYAFTEQGVSMLSGILNSDIAIQVNINIMRAFVLMRERLRQISDNSLRFEQLTNEIQNLRLEVNDILRDQNDINESVLSQQNSIAKQLESINNALAELQAEKIQHELNKQRTPIGFIKPEK